MKNGDDYFNLIHNTDSDKTNPTYMVKVMKCRVSVIRVKRGGGEVWITICIGIIVIVIHIIKMSKK